MGREVAENRADAPVAVDGNARGAANARGTVADTVAETFGDRLRRLRRKRGISRSKLSIAARVPEQNIGRWEKGYPCTDLLGCARMAAVLGVSMDYLVHADTDVLASATEEEGAEESIALEDGNAQGELAAVAGTESCDVSEVV